MSEIDLPEEYQERGWKASILDENGKIDVSKTLKKIDGLEVERGRLMGAKSIPTKDSTEEEWSTFAKKMTEGYSDTDYDQVLAGLETKAEAIEKLKSAGFTPKQAKAAAEIALAEKVEAVSAKYSPEKFQEEFLKKVPDEKARKKAESVLVKSGLWDSLLEASNEEALNTCIAASKIGLAYDVDDALGGAKGDPNNIAGNGKGYGEEYVKRCFELAKTMPREQAVAQAKKEFSIGE